MIGLRIDNKYDADILLANKTRTHSSSQVIYFVEQVKGGAEQKLIKLKPAIEKKLALNLAKYIKETGDATNRYNAAIFYNMLKDKRILVEYPDWWTSPNYMR